MNSLREEQRNAIASADHHLQPQSGVAWDERAVDAVGLRDAGATTGVSDVLVFTQNRKANLDALPPVAWQVITNIGFNGFHNFVYTVDTQVSLTWEGGASGILPSEVLEGGVYSLNLVDRDFEFTRSGVTLGNEIDVWNNVHTPNGIDVTLIKDGKPIMTQPGVGYGSQAEFGLTPKIYVGLVSNIIESDTLTTAVMSQQFTPIDLTSLTFALYGDRQQGYYFNVTNSTT